MATSCTRRAVLAAVVLVTWAAVPVTARASHPQREPRVAVTEIPVPAGYRAAFDATGQRTYIEGGWVTFEVYGLELGTQDRRVVVRDPRGGTQVLPDLVESVADVSRRGHVVGSGGSLPFVWRHGELTVLPTATDRGAARAVNDRGQVAGLMPTADPTASGTRWTAVVWHRGRTLVPPGTEESSAKDINNRGDVAIDIASGGSPPVAALWRPGRGVTELGTLGGDSSIAVAVNDRGEVAGNSQTADGTTHGFLWRDGEMTDLGTLGGENSQVLGMNDRGDVIGRSRDADGVFRGFVWRGGEMIDLTLEGHLAGRAEAINDRGQVVGESQGLDGIWHYLWEDGRAVNVGRLLADEGYGSTVLADIDDRGRMVVSATVPRPDGENAHQFLLVAVR